MITFTIVRLYENTTNRCFFHLQNCFQNTAQHYDYELTNQEYNFKKRRLKKFNFELLFVILMLPEIINLK